MHTLGQIISILKIKCNKTSLIVSQIKSTVNLTPQISLVFSQRIHRHHMRNEGYCFPLIYFYVIALTLLSVNIVHPPSSATVTPSKCVHSITSIHFYKIPPCEANMKCTCILVNIKYIFQLNLKL